MQHLQSNLINPPAPAGAAASIWQLQHPMNLNLHSKIVGAGLLEPMPWDWVWGEDRILVQLVPPIPLPWPDLPFSLPIHTCPPPPSCFLRWLTCSGEQRGKHWRGREGAVLPDSTPSTVLSGVLSECLLRLVLYSSQHQRRRHAASGQHACDWVIS